LAEAQEHLTLAQSGNAQSSSGISNALNHLRENQERQHEIRNRIATLTATRSDEPRVRESGDGQIGPANSTERVSGSGAATSGGKRDQQSASPTPSGSSAAEPPIDGRKTTSDKGDGLKAAEPSPEASGNAESYRGLQSRLDAVRTAIQRDQPEVARNQLAAYVSQFGVEVRANSLTEGQKRALTDSYAELLSLVEQLPGGTRPGASGGATGNGKPTAAPTRAPSNERGKSGAPTH
jgi:hypothetical protein